MNEFIKKIESLDNICQWEERDSVIKESVSQHSFKVAAICHYILRNIEKFLKHENINTLSFCVFKYNCLSYSIMHDFDEAIIGRDISHIVKYNAYNGKIIRDALDEYVEKMTVGIFDNVYIKPDVNVKTFVKLCDWIALYTFILRNERMGVKTFCSEKKYCYENIEKKRIEVSDILKKEFKIEQNINLFTL